MQSEYLVDMWVRFKDSAKAFKIDLSKLEREIGGPWLVVQNISERSCCHLPGHTDAVIAAAFVVLLYDLQVKFINKSIN